MIACYIEGFKDGRTLMLAADHAAQLRKPIVMVKVGRTDDGPRRWRSRTPATSPAPTRSPSAVFRQFGVTRVDGLDELLEVSAALARTRPDEVPTWAKRSKRAGRLRLRDLRRHRRAHGRHARRRRACASPTSRKDDAADAARRADPRVPARVEPGRLRRPAGRRRARPQDPRRDPRRPERRHPRRPDHRRGRDVQRAVHARPHRRRADDRQADLRGLGRARRAPTTRTTSGCSTAACPCSARSATAWPRCEAYVDYWTFAARYRSPFDDAPTDAARPRRRRRARSSPTARAGRGAVGVAARSSCSSAYGIKTSQGRAVHVGRGSGEGRERDRLPGRDEGRRRPTCCTRATSGSCRSASTSAEGRARRVRRAAARRPSRPAGKTAASTACSCARW